MARHATIIGQVRDWQGELWDIRESRPTSHGWPLLLGWPADMPRGQGSGGPRVIITSELQAYLEAQRLTPNRITLPIGKTALKRLRKLLGMDWQRDNNKWWDENPDGPGKCYAARSIQRKKRGIKSSLWTEDEIQSLVSMRGRGLTWMSIACALGRSESAVRVKMFKLKKHLNLSASVF